MKQEFHQRERALELLSKEVGYVRKPHGGKLRVALAFPNTYFVGMSNLGFQTVYKLFNEEAGIVCERFFLPPKTELAALGASGAPLITLESQTPVREFDVVAFSVSFETASFGRSMASRSASQCASVPAPRSRMSAASSLRVDRLTRPNPRGNSVSDTHWLPARW